MKNDRSALWYLLLIFSLTGIVGAQARPRVAATSAVSTSKDSGVCSMLGSAEIKQVQKDSVEESKASELINGDLRTFQCFYRTKNFTDSVSLAVTAGDKQKPQAARDYWKLKISTAAALPVPAQPTSKSEAKQVKHHPRKVAGIGEEAWWMGDRKAGALYVLNGNSFFRISVGGAGAEEEKIQRSKLLAQFALKRVPKS